MASISRPDATTTGFHFIGLINAQQLSGCCALPFMDIMVIMPSFLELNKNSDSLHHAYYFVEHELEDAVNNLKNFLGEVIGFKISGNPDFSHRKYKNFTIDDARVISEGESRKDFSGNKKIFIIETDFITEEAQNALLKVFEEPTEGTHFFIISPQEVLLPTLRSRMHVFASSLNSTPMPRTVLGMSMKERLEMVKEITDGIKDEEMSKQDAIALLNQIERELYQKGVLEMSEQLKACEKARESLYDRGAPVKIILENLMLSV